MQDEQRDHVLVVDDTEANRYAICRVLANAGFAVSEATTGEDALRLVAAKPDLIVLDIRLPDIDGYEVCRRIKADSATAQIPVLQVSAIFVHASDHTHGLRNGADGFLAQPVDPSVLAATAKSLIRSRRPAAARASRQQATPAAVPLPSRPAGQQSLRLLLVEDHEDSAKVLSRLLHLVGHSVRIATSMTEALKLAGEAEFDLVISDIGLPDGSGHDLMRQLSQRHGLKGIALTGRGMEEDIREARDAGFVAHVLKPVDLATLEAAVREAMSEG